MSGDGPPERPSGPQLHTEVRRYCAKVRCSQADFSRASGITAQTLVSIELADRPLVRTVQRVRDFIAANPDCLPEETPRGWLPAASVNVRGPSLVKSGAGAAGLVTARAASVAPARPSIAATIAAEAEDAARRRRGANMASHRTPLAHTLPHDASAGEVLSTALIETPGDLIARVRARWPELWAGVIDRARQSGVPAGAMLMTVIERGLEEISA